MEPAYTGSILQMAKVLYTWRSPFSLLNQISKNRATLINVSSESLAGLDPFQNSEANFSIQFQFIADKRILVQD